LSDQKLSFSSHNYIIKSVLGIGTKPRKHEQRLLRNMGVHKVVIDLLQIPYDKVF
jgi:inositol 1,4,5-triphosphate receptor type 1